MTVYTSHGVELWARYNLYKTVGLQWTVCDMMMYKFWIVHFFNQILPEMDPVGDILNELGF